MDATKAARMAVALETIQQRWGAQALQTVRQSLARTPPPRGIRSGFPALDALLPTGIPPSQTTELLGAPTSGVLTLALKIGAAAQTTNASVIYVDLEETFDPYYAAVCGMDLNRLILVRPDTPVEGLDIARELLLSGQVGVLTLDLGRLMLEASLLRRFTQALVTSGCVVLLLLWVSSRRAAYQRSSPAPLRLFVERKAWLRRGQDVVGYRSTVTILKGHAPQKQQVDIDIEIEQMVGGSK